MEGLVFQPYLQPLRQHQRLTPLTSTQLDDFRDDIHINQLQI